VIKQLSKQLKQSVIAYILCLVGAEGVYVIVDHKIDGLFIPIFIAIVLIYEIITAFIKARKSKDQ
jgi:hypothetical protein